MKLRSDNFLTGSGFKQVQHFTKRVVSDSIFTERVVVSTCYFRRYSAGYPVIMLPRDFFHFGRTEDLLIIWDLPLFEDFIFDPNKLGQKQHACTPKMPLYPEQKYCQQWLGDLDHKAPRLTHRHDTNAPSITYWERFIASNLVVLEPAQICLGLTSRFIPKTKRPNEISHRDWLFTYKKCWTAPSTLLNGNYFANWGGDECSSYPLRG
jgi:WavE lipopolysaccharide synthesis